MMDSPPQASGQESPRPPGGHDEARDSRKVGGGLSFTRHSFTSLGKRRPFSRKPSSWRHPGGTVSETEETDFSECEADTANERDSAERRRPGHVQSFNFPSLSVFRSKHSSGSGDQSPSLTSQLSIEEERLSGDRMELPKHLTGAAPGSRSPNRKFKEATDKVGDKLRAYAQKFKDTRERDKGGRAAECPATGGRSASAGRSETIEEETTEDVEAERAGAGVARAYSLNSKVLPKPLLQSHSSTESTDVQTPKSTPTRNKKKLSLKKLKGGDSDMLSPGPNKKRSSKLERSCEPVTSDDSPAPLGLSDHEHLLSPIGSPSQDFPFTFPEVVRQAIQEVDTLTEKCAQENDVSDEGRRLTPTYTTDSGNIRHQVMTRRMSDNFPDARRDVDSTSVQSERISLPNVHARASQADEDSEEDERNLAGKLTVKKFSPTAAGSGEVQGHRSRQGSKRRRKKDASKVSSPPKLKLKLPSKDNCSGVSPRSASYTSLRTSPGELDPRNFRSCLSSSPCPSTSKDRAEKQEVSSPQIIFTGSSTLPRSSSESRRSEAGTSATGPVSILTLQLEGAFGCSMSVSETGSREDTISPMVSQKTDPNNISGKGDGSRTEVDVKNPNTLDDVSYAKDKRNLKSCGLLYPELMKTRSATIELQEKHEDLDEEVEDLEGNPEFSLDGTLVNEIKIAEVIEMMCEEAEENDFHSLYQEFRAAVVEVENDPSDIDDEVAQLTRMMDLDKIDNEEQLPFKAFTPNIYTDWRQDDLGGLSSGHNITPGSIKLLVQDYDTAEETNDEDMPDLDTFEADWDTEMEADSAPLFPNSVSLTGADTGVKRHWSQPGPGIIYPKSATFPRQSQKVDDNMVTSVITSQTGSSLYYPVSRENIMHLTESQELEQQDFQYNFNSSQFHSIGAPDDGETDVEEERSQIESRTIQEAIKQEAKKLVPTSSGEKTLYGYSEKEFLLPGQVYGSNFPPNHPPGCFEIPDGFVTPIRSTPHRNLTSSPCGSEDFKSGSARPSRVSRRQLRGPFGQMLMEEMAKTEVKLGAGPAETEVQPPDLLTMTSVMTVVTSTAPVISHQRTRSSPSKLDYTPVSAPELNFANISGDKLTVAQELLVPRNAARRTEEPGPGPGKGLVHTSSFRRAKDKRSLIVQETFNLEKSYVESLQFLVLKYMNPLKNPENSHIIDNVLVDDIFFQIPNILHLHESFLEDIKRRLENWDNKKTIGDWFINCFTKKPLVDAYTAFIRNVKRADDAIKIARTTKPAFDRFLQDMRQEREIRKLSLTDLLAKPFQRIPRYRLLLKRLLEHTDQAHEDYLLLRKAEKEIHELAIRMSTIEKESNEQETRQQQLRQLEIMVHGLAHNDLVAASRTLIRLDMVTTSTSPWSRKDRCLFLFNDIILISSVSRRGTKDFKRAISTSPSNLNTVLEMCRHKLWMYLTLSDVEICKTKEDNLKKMMKEYGEIDSDLKIVQQLSDQATKLRCPHKELDDALKSLLGNLSKQVSERQATELSHASFLQLNINTNDGVETLNIAFDTPDRKNEWEEAFVKAKEKLDDTGAAPPPDLLSLIPIRKTRAGLQFTSAAPTLGLNSHNLKDVWVCNSDGYVGQVCVLSLKPEPTVVCCNGVCNARILSIVSVPNLPCAGATEHAQWGGGGGGGDWPAEWGGGTGWSTPDSSNIEWGAQGAGGGAEGGTADSSPQSGNTGHLDIEDEVESSEEEEDRELGKQNYLRMEPRSSPPQATMWLGTEDGTIHVYNCTDNIRIKKNKDKFCHTAPILAILYLNNKVFASLGNGHIVIYSRDSSGVWDKTGFECLTVGTSTYPVRKMVVIGGNIWCGTSNIIKILNPVTKEVQDMVTVGSDETKVILAMAESGQGVWVAQQGSASVRLLHSVTFITLVEVSTTAAVAKMLTYCDEIIRQHKTACLRVTSLLAVKDMLWVGTSAGVIVTLIVPPVTATTTKLASAPPLTGIPHGHTGHVRFLSCVDMSPEPGPASGGHSRGPGLARLSAGRKEAGPGRILVISGGDGYEDFSSSGSSELAGREDSTNHLLLWVV